MCLSIKVIFICHAGWAESINQSINMHFFSWRRMSRENEPEAPMDDCQCVACTQNPFIAVRLGSFVNCVPEFGGTASEIRGMVTVFASSGQCQKTMKLTTHYALFVSN